MTFIEGNQLGALGKGVPKSRAVAWNNYGEAYFVKFTPRYQELMEKIAANKTLTEADKEFMNRFETQQEYFVPKLQRKILQGPGGESIFQDISPEKRKLILSDLDE